jgi:hypothetical protein
MSKAIRWTPEQLEAHHARRTALEAIQLPQAPTVDSLTAIVAKGSPRASKMNKLEAAYAQHLDALKHAGKVLWWKYEALGLRLADKTFYHPDFMVLTAEGVLEIHETKGFMQDDANVKLKVAACSFPFVFKLIKRAAKKDGGDWLIKEV